MTQMYNNYSCKGDLDKVNHRGKVEKLFLDYEMEPPTYTITPVAYVIMP